MLGANKIAVIRVNKGLKPCFIPYITEQTKIKTGITKTNINTPEPVSMINNGNT